MTAKEVRDKDTEHLKHELAEQTKHLFELRSQAVTEKLEDPSQIGKTRRNIARIKTILRERRDTEAKAPPAEKEVAEAK